MFELTSDEGLIDIIEGEGVTNYILASGFSYGAVPIRVTTMTYSDFTAGGYNLSHSFDSDEVPVDAADGMVMHVGIKPG